MNNKFSRYVVAGMLITATIGLSACVGAAVGAGATLGVAAAQEGGIKAAATDASIRIQINDLWFKHSVDMYRRLDLTIKEGRVLVTGTVPEPDMRVDAIRLAWQADGVRQVINEIRVEDTRGFATYTQDVWISSQLRTKMTFDRDVQSINYNVDTVKGTVYIMGIAQDETERQHVIDIARNIQGVTHVVSYIRIRGEVPTGLQSPTGVEG